MPYLLLPHKWKELPNYPVQLNWNHPIARKLLFFAIPQGGKGTDLVSLADSSALGSGVSIGGGRGNQPGRAFNFSGSQATGACSWGDTTFLDGVRGFTVDMLLRSGDGKPFSKWGSGNSFLVQISAGNVIWVTDDIASLRSRRDSTTTTVPSFQFHLTCSWEDSGVVSNNGAIYFDGISQPTGSASNLSTGAANSAAVLQLGVASDGSPITGSIHFARIWGRTLTQYEVLSLAKEPYQLLKQDMRPVYFFPTSSSSVTLTADSASYAVSAQAVALKIAETSSSAAYSYSATSVGLNESFTAASASYTDTAQSVTLATTLTASASSFTVAAQDANLIVGGPIVLTAASASYLVSASDATLTLSSSQRQGSGGSNRKGRVMTYAQREALRRVEEARKLEEKHVEEPAKEPKEQQKKKEPEQIIVKPQLVLDDLVQLALEAEQKKREELDIDDEQAILLLVQEAVNYYYA